jgi:Pyruvate/2-oxoacid:ferredoxin oxidoreductase delta subunit
MKENRPPYDERDTIFSRMGELKAGTERYHDYYRSHPEWEAIDRELREQGPGRFADHTLEQTRTGSTFAFLKDIRPLVEGIPAGKKIILSKEEVTKQLKKIAADYGCVLSGVCKMEDSFFYSVRGRGKHYGESVNPGARPYGFIFAVEMEGENILKAPGPAEMVEVTRGYARTALAGMVISYWIRSLGYDALCHMDGETEIVMPPAAEKAGLGEIGRMGLLVNREYGARLRLGAVTTNLELVVDSPVSFGLKDYCIKCRKCALFCPSKSIDEGENWGAVNHESCFKMWKELDTDCGVCLASCPFSLKGIKDREGELNLKQFMYEQNEQKGNKNE